jgi:hypothetical protein
MTDPCPPEKRSPLEHEHGELTPERIERLKAEVMTLETPYGLWVTAEDYVALSADLAAAKTPRETRTCPLGDDCDLTVAWMAGAAEAKDEAAADYEEAYARGFSAGQEALKGIDNLEVIDSPEVADLRAKLDEAVEALRSISGQPDYADDPWTIARATLDSITGDGG